MTFSPAGFLRTPEQGLARLHWHEGAWAVDGQALDLAQLRPLRGLNIDWPTAEGVPDSGRPSGGAHGAGRSGVEGAHDAEWPGVEDALGGLARLAAAGVPLTAADAPAWVPVELAALLTDRELARAHRGRRRAVRWPTCGARSTAYGCAARLRPPAAGSRPPRSAWSCRPSGPGASAARSPRWRGSAGSRWRCCSACTGSAYDEVRQAVEACPLPLRWVEAGAETPFGEVLNQAAALAGGDYLAKWDDDDWYGPDHLADLIMARPITRAPTSWAPRPSSSTWSRCVPRSGARRSRPAPPIRARSGPITSRAARLWSPVAKFRDIGGFPALPRAVDREFLKAAHEAGARIYRTHGLGYMLRRAAERPAHLAAPARPLPQSRHEPVARLPPEPADGARPADGVTHGADPAGDRMRVRGNDYRMPRPARDRYHADAAGQRGRARLRRPGQARPGAGRARPADLPAGADRGHRRRQRQHAAAAAARHPPAGRPADRLRDARPGQRPQRRARRGHRRRDPLARLRRGARPPGSIEAHMRWHHAAPYLVVDRVHALHARPRCPPSCRDDLEPSFEPAEPHAWIVDLVERDRRAHRQPTPRPFSLHVGGATSVNARLFALAGPMDDELILGQDTEMGYRLAQAGRGVRTRAAGPCLPPRARPCGCATRQRIDRVSYAFVADRIPRLPLAPLPPRPAVEGPLRRGRRRTARPATRGPRHRRRVLAGTMLRPAWSSSAPGTRLGAGSAARR